MFTIDYKTGYWAHPEDVQGADEEGGYPEFDVHAVLPDGRAACGYTPPEGWGYQLVCNGLAYWHINCLGCKVHMGHHWRGAAPKAAPAGDGPKSWGSIAR